MPSLQHGSTATASTNSATLQLFTPPMKNSTTAANASANASASGYHTGVMEVWTNREVSFICSPNTFLLINL